jgi:dipeptidyl aminopeptidase/acylaminoacyl peptidase
MKKIVLVVSLFILLFLGGKLAFSFLFKDNPKAAKVSVSDIKNNAVQSPISIDYLRSKNITGDKIVIEEELQQGQNYKQYIVSYRSEGNKIFGLLTVPMEEMPKGGFPAIVFNHGYIPPSQYTTTGRYVAYVDYLARNGFVVFKIDFRGNGKSEGDPSGSYFSSAYTIDAISALKSLQSFDKVNPKRIGMWGHSMAGNAVLRAMEISPDIKAGVIWAGAVYSYQDFAKYGISDSSFAHRPDEQKSGVQQAGREVSSEIQKIRSSPKTIDFSSSFWKAISLTQNIHYISAPLELHHAINDPTVNIQYSRDLASELKKQKKRYELFEYEGGGHNIESPYFETAMERTVQFFKTNL